MHSRKDGDRRGYSWSPTQDIFLIWRWGQLAPQSPSNSDPSFSVVQQGVVAWEPCEEYEGFECAKVPVPINHHHATDLRRAVSRRRTWSQDRINLHQPRTVPCLRAEVGTSDLLPQVSSWHARRRGTSPKSSEGTTILYDLIRGASARQSCTCFGMRLDAEVFASVGDEFNLNIPATITSEVMRLQMAAAKRALAAKCGRCDVMFWNGSCITRHRRDVETHRWRRR
ncbi:hypothetical protein NEOLEDRAFT_53813 [Neolentinus lepideus HHB14362 ss-1]|uniref:Uncharacterized protein n=1 Tax=Neolentinus lepideus HHB14362 ss-1 TaxID=1314782 RepID=A0A165WCI9_9AGAM|nr:hypothetical protein NEOLEDRAFT_53813 [Neolentinus lepideus HHB14362 ss-1]